jgi:hypothetical protein
MSFIMRKPRLLIPISIHFSVRYVLRTGLLQKIAEHAQPVILLAWQDAELEAELRSAGAEVHRLIEPDQTARYDRIRSYINVLHLRQLNTVSGEIRERRADLDRTFWIRHRRRLRKRILEGFFALGGSQWLLRKEAELLWSDTNVRVVSDQLNRLRPDAVFTVTPFLREEDAVLRMCSAQQIPMCTAILSFDNLTTRGWIPVTFDKYLVWNRHNVAELFRAYPAARHKTVEIVGVPHFDFYRDPSYLWDEATWRRRHRLPEGRPVILFGGGFHSCAPHEPSFLSQLNEDIESKAIPGNPVVLFRNHPVDPIERWQEVLRAARHVVWDDPAPTGRVRGKTNLQRQDIEKLASCLYHSRVHVNVASTMAVDGAIMDRPQVGPAYDDTPGALYDRSSKELYWQEHYVPITKSGGLDIAFSREEFTRGVRSALEDPERCAQGRRRMVREICTFDDGAATARVARAVRTFLEGQTVEEPVGASAGARHHG